MMLLYVHIVDMYFKNYVHILTVAWWILKYILSSAVTVPQYVYKVWHMTISFMTQRRVMSAYMQVHKDAVLCNLA